MTVLVGYATRHGSTAEVAQHIGDRLRTHGVEADVLPLSDAVDPSGYEAVVFGSAVYSGSWLPEALRFVRRNVQVLVERPVWTFSVGLLLEQGGLLRGVAWPDAGQLGDVRSQVHQRDHEFFGGVMSPATLRAVRRWTFRAVGGRYGDFRDWERIDAWADYIGERLASGVGDRPKPELL